MRAFVDKDICIGCGLCPTIEPSVFRMGDDDKAEAYAEAEGDAKGNVLEAVDSCPVSSITAEQ